MMMREGENGFWERKCSGFYTPNNINLKFLILKFCSTNERDLNSFLPRCC